MCAITGSGYFAPLASRYKVPMAVSGFKDKELLVAIYGLVKMAEEGLAEVRNYYPSVVESKGNAKARDKLEKYFMSYNAVWRGIGEVENSGLILREAYSRYDMGSRNAPLGEMVQGLIDEKIKVHVLRDVTRGGLGTVLKELSQSSNCLFEIMEDEIPVSQQVSDFCGLLGLDPLYMGNEGKMVAIVACEDAHRALDIIRKSKYGQDARIIGSVAEQLEGGKLILKTAIGGRRNIEVLQGEGLPRIC